MNIQDFFYAYEGIWAESNKSSDLSTYDQCIDAWRAYNRKVINAPDIFGNPPDIWEKYQTEFYERILNTPEGVPQLGDVIIWGTRYGKYGHIAICTDIADTKTFTSFDQNDPINSSCHFQPHTYTGILGWLRPKKAPDNLQNIILEVIANAFNSLPANDPLKNGNLEGYARAIVEDHKNYKDEIENETIIDQYKKFIYDLREALKCSSDDFANLIGKAESVRMAANSHKDFVRDVGEIVGCSSDDEEAVKEAVKGQIATISTDILTIKNKKIMEFSAKDFLWGFITKLIYRK